MYLSDSFSRLPAIVGELGIWWHLLSDYQAHDRYMIQIERRCYQGARGMQDADMEALLLSLPPCYLSSGDLQLFWCTFTETFASPCFDIQRAPSTARTWVNSVIKFHAG